MSNYLELHSLYHSAIAKEELDRRKANYAVLNRDFLEDLPFQVRDVLDRLKWDYGSRAWFPEAWEKYRKHVIEAGLGGKIKMPGAVFNEYLDKYELKELEKLYRGEGASPVYHSDIYVEDYLMHHGVKGQKWGVRRFMNEDGSLTPEGKARYGYDESTGQMSAKGEKLFRKERVKNIRQSKDIRGLQNVQNVALAFGGASTAGQTAVMGKQIYDKIAEKYGKEAAEDYRKDELKRELGAAAVLGLLAATAAVAPMAVKAIKSKN